MSEQKMNDSTFGRLFIIMIIVMVILTIIIMILASLVSSDVNAKLDEIKVEENSPSIAQRLIPVGQFNTQIASAAPVVAAVLTGEEAYTSCAVCHATGIAGAPQIGANEAWSARIAQGKDTLYSNAINGYTGKAGVMPAKGGNIALSDDNVRAAVDYMVDQVQ